MKKAGILLILCIGIWSNCQLQIDNNPTKNLLPTAVTAETYGISKIGKNSIDLFRGKVNVSIPLYTINVDNLNIPLSVSYNTGGIKLNEVATSVGLGWSLNIPGYINHTIQGKDDFSIPLFNKDINIYSSYSGEISHLDYDEVRRNNLWSIYSGAYDTKPDLFHYSIPTESGSFIMENNNGLTIPNSNIEISYISGQGLLDRRFKIRDEVGNTYLFSTQNISSSNDPRNIQGIDIHAPMYKLDSIITVNDKVIKFTYGKALHYTEINNIEQINIKIGNDYDPGNSYFNGTPKYEKWESSTSSSENLITQIDFPTGKIEFQYSNDQNGGLSLSDGSLYRKDIDSPNGVALRKIVVTNNTSIIKEYILNYDYFNSNSSNKTYMDYRLKLLNIHDIFENTFHKFNYNEDYPFPARSTNSDDYWGYINSISGDLHGSNLPLRIYTEEPINNPDFPSIQRRDKSPNPILSQIGILKTVTYPTGGKKNYYFESPFMETINTNTYTLSDGLTKEITSFPDPNDPLGGLYDDKTETFEFTTTDYPPNHESLTTTYGFSNTCKNAELTGDINELAETSCFGDINFIDPQTNNIIKHFSSNGRQFSGEVKISPPFKIQLVLSRMGDCRCSVEAGLVWTYEVINNSVSKSYLPGLRIKKIEDIDANNISNIVRFKYGKHDASSNKFEDIAVLKKPINFTKIYEKPRRVFHDFGEHPPYFQKFLMFSNSGQAYNSYGSSDIVTYPFVIEETDLGKVLYEFSDNDYKVQNLNIFDYVDYNDWKNGLLLNKKYLNKNGDTIKNIRNEYEMNHIKNSLSDYNSNSITKIGFAVDMEIVPSKILLMSVGGNTLEGDIFYVKNRINYIESAKIENTSTTTRNFFQNNRVETKVMNSYHGSDVNKPINLKTQKTTFSDESTVETSYQYASEKQNQKLIDANMIGIPLETTVLKNGKMINKSEVKYDQPTHLFPTSVLSLNTENNSMSTEITYDSYDNKGNLQQYTTKSGVSTAIIWGYNQTQPIAKVEGAKLSDISQTLIASIVDASDYSSAGYSESNLISKLDAFRSGLPNFQVTAYTYIPLVGVTTITPPSGIREFYIYDSANRLQAVKDVNENILKEYKYNYKQ